MSRYASTFRSRFSGVKARADGECDSCGGPISATISFIADRAEFTPPVLYSKENRAKLVYLVEARPAPDIAARLNPGQPVDVTLPPSQ
jgi:HlyD family secretion protein